MFDAQNAQIVSSDNTENLGNRKVCFGNFSIDEDGNYIIDVESQENTPKYVKSPEVSDEDFNKIVANISPQIDYLGNKFQVYVTKSNIDLIGLLSEIQITHIGSGKSITISFSDTINNIGGPLSNLSKISDFFNEHRTTD